MDWNLTHKQKAIHALFFLYAYYSILLFCHQFPGIRGAQLLFWGIENGNNNNEKAIEMWKNDFTVDGASKSTNWCASNNKKSDTQPSVLPDIH